MVLNEDNKKAPGFAASRPEDMEGRGKRQIGDLEDKTRSSRRNGGTFRGLAAGTLVTALALGSCSYLDSRSQARNEALIEAIQSEGELTREVIAPIVDYTAITAGNSTTIADNTGRTAEGIDSLLKCVGCEDNDLTSCSRPVPRPAYVPSKPVVSTPAPVVTVPVTPVAVTPESSYLDTYVSQWRGNNCGWDNLEIDYTPNSGSYRDRNINGVLNCVPELDCGTYNVKSGNVQYSISATPDNDLYRLAASFDRFKDDRASYVVIKPSTVGCTVRTPRDPRDNDEPRAPPRDDPRDSPFGGGNKSGEGGNSVGDGN